MNKEFYKKHTQLEHNMIDYLVRTKKFSQEPFIILDVGTRFGFEPVWDVFGDNIKLIGFEPDKEECEMLKKKYSEDKKKILEDIALWDTEGFQTLYVTRRQSSSSCLRPNASFFKRLPDASPMDIIRTVQVPTTTLDNYCEKKDLHLDVVKLDVQGGELNVLKGGDTQLKKSVLAVIIEVEFVELYENQPLFSEIEQFMKRHEFSLFDLDIKRWRRKSLPHLQSDFQIGQVVYANALYLKDPICYDRKQLVKNESSTKLLKLASLAELFSLPDYAIELLSFGKESNILSQEETSTLIKLAESNQIIDNA